MQTSDAKEVALSDLLRRWEQVQDEFDQCAAETGAAAEQRQGDLGEEAGTIEQRMVETPAQTIPDLLVKFRLAHALVKMFHADYDNLPTDERKIEDRLIRSAFADLERLTA